MTLTVVATMGIAFRAQAQDPCDAASFNGKVCSTAIHRGGYCAQGMWVPMTYPQSYPDYYDLYQNYMSNGGVVAMAPDEKCRHGSGAGHGGFGFFGRTHHHAGS